MCSFHDESIFLRRFEKSEEKPVGNEGSAVGLGVTMDRSGSWKLGPGDSRIPELSELEAWRKVGGNPHLI